MNSRSEGANTHARLEGDDGLVSRLAQQNKTPWYSKPNLRLLYLLMFPTCLAVETTHGFDASMINGLQAVSSWVEYFHHPRSLTLGIMVASYFLGFATAVPFVPFVVDKMGRRYPIFIGGAISMIGGIMQGSALNVTMFIIARIILGAANLFSLVSASSLIGELSHPNERATMGSLFRVAHSIGSITAAGIILGTFSMTNNWGWRIPSFFQIVPSILQVSFIWLLPESPRWLVSRGRKSEAYAILEKYHADGDKGSEFVKAEFAQIEQTLEAEQKVSKTSWKVMFSTPGIRRRSTIAIFLALSSDWNGVGLTSYFLSPILDSIGIHDNKTKNIFNLAKLSWTFVTAMLVAFTAPRYPRRTVFLTGAIAIFVMFSAWTAASADYSLTHRTISARIVLVLIFLCNLAYNIELTLTYTYLVELFPFHVRAKGLSLFQWWHRVGAFMTHIANPIGIDAAGWKWYLVYCVWNALQVVFVFFMFPETSGRTLEELSFLYESDEAAMLDGSENDGLRDRRGTEAQYGTMVDTPRRVGP